MKTGSTAPRTQPLAESERPYTQKGIIYNLPAGTRFSDIYMDTQSVALELNFCKRTISNMRRSGKLSYTTLNGKIYYYRQEIAGMLEANKIMAARGLMLFLSMIYGW
ncbi:MAG: helix-turn-helix domain-containing protein [Ginsengibacter sp.]